MQLIFGPKWFFGRDIIIDTISVFVMFLIIIFVFRSYLISKNRKYLFIGSSFFVIILSFLFKILMNFTIYYSIIDTRRYGEALITLERIISSDNLFYIGLLGSRLLMLFGLYILYCIYNKQTKSNFVLTFYFLVVAIFESQESYVVYYVTCFVLLSLITYRLLQTYLRNRHMNSKLLMISFLIISLSQIVFLYTWDLTYVVAEIIQFLGYVLLLLTFILVLNHGKKKIKD